MTFTLDFPEWVINNWYWFLLIPYIPISWNIMHVVARRKVKYYKNKIINDNKELSKFSSNSPEYKKLNQIIKDDRFYLGFWMDLPADCSNLLEDKLSAYSSVIVIAPVSLILFSLFKFVDGGIFKTLDFVYNLLLYPTSEKK